jgi:hypothetical protein
MTLEEHQRRGDAADALFRGAGLPAPYGVTPGATGVVATTAFVAVSITDTVLSLLLVM